MQLLRQLPSKLIKGAVQEVQLLVMRLQVAQDGWQLSQFLVRLFGIVI